MTYIPGGGGGGSLSTQGDVALNNPDNDEVLSYNAELAKWQNSPSNSHIHAIEHISGLAGYIQTIESLQARVLALEGGTPTPVPVGGYELVYSVNADRSSPVTFGGTIPANAYVFTTPNEGIYKVTFYIDGTLERTENNAPYDLKGANSTTDAPNPLNLSEGSHVVRAEILGIDGNTYTVDSSVTVEAPVTQPTPDPEPTGTKPSASNTGPSGALTNSSGMTVSTNGAVIQNLNINGVVTISASNVTIRNCRVTSNSYYAINIKSGCSDTLIEDCEVIANGSSPQASIGNSATNTTIRRCNVYGHGDGIKVKQNDLVEWCYVHPTRLPGSDKHLDAIQGDGDASGVVIRYNTLNVPISVGGNAAIIINGSLSDTLGTITYTGNWVNGGNYTFYASNKSGASPSMITVTNNKFGRDFRYGLYAVKGSNKIISGNTWEDTGEPINANP